MSLVNTSTSMSMNNKSKKDIINQIEVYKFIIILLIF